MADETDLSGLRQRIAEHKAKERQKEETHRNILQERMDTDRRVRERWNRQEQLFEKIVEDLRSELGLGAAELKLDHGPPTTQYAPGLLTRRIIASFGKQAGILIVATDMSGQGTCKIDGENTRQPTNFDFLTLSEDGYKRLIVSFLDRMV